MHSPCGAPSRWVCWVDLRQRGQHRVAGWLLIIRVLTGCCFAPKSESINYKLRFLIICWLLTLLSSPTPHLRSPPPESPGVTARHPLFRGHRKTSFVYKPRNTSRHAHLHHLYQSYCCRSTISASLFHWLCVLCPAARFNFSLSLRSCCLRGS